MKGTDEYNEKVMYELYDKIKKDLKHHRFIHSVGVAGTAASLAMKYDADVYKAQVAGILHDCAKYYDDEELIRLCKKNDIEITKVEEENGFLLHAKYGAYLARKKYEIDDEDIISAIKWHTTGRMGMTLLEKIIFIADYIEPTRNKADNLDRIREAAFRTDDIDDTVRMILKSTIDYLKKSGSSIDSTTFEAYEYYNKGR